jgi:hypothetical protein
VTDDFGLQAAEASERLRRVLTAAHEHAAAIRRDGTAGAERELARATGERRDRITEQIAQLRSLQDAVSTGSEELQAGLTGLAGKIYAITAEETGKQVVPPVAAAAAPAAVAAVLDEAQPEPKSLRHRPLIPALGVAAAGILFVGALFTVLTDLDETGLTRSADSADTRAGQTAGSAQPGPGGEAGAPNAPGAGPGTGGESRTASGRNARGNGRDLAGIAGAGATLAVSRGAAGIAGDGGGRTTPADSSLAGAPAGASSEPTGASGSAEGGSGGGGDGSGAGSGDGPGVPAPSAPSPPDPPGVPNNPPQAPNPPNPPQTPSPTVPVDQPGLDLPDLIPEPGPSPESEDGDHDWDDKWDDDHDWDEDSDHGDKTDYDEDD